MTATGSPIGRTAAFIGRSVFNLSDTAIKLTGGAFKLYGQFIKGSFKLVTGAGKAILNGLGRFNPEGRTHQAMMIQAQAATVDKLEMIRIMLDKRLPNSGKSFNDEDGDGWRDGSYMEQLQAKRKKKKEDKAKAKQDKKDSKNKSKNKEKGEGGLLQEILGNVIGSP